VVCRTGGRCPGPDTACSRDLTARADGRGEAIVTLDVARSSDLGEYYAVLEPYPEVDALRHPRLVVFFVQS
jgi:hypothetical protein